MFRDILYQVTKLKLNASKKIYGIHFSNILFKKKDLKF